MLAAQLSWLSTMQLAKGSKLRARQVSEATFDVLVQASIAWDDEHFQHLMEQLLDRWESHWVAEVMAQPAQC